MRLYLLCLGPRKKSHGQEETETGEGTRRMWVTRRVGGISPECANKQTPEGEVGVMEKCERGHRVCRGSGSRGSPACSGRAGEAAAAGPLERGGRFPEPRAGGAPEPGCAGPGGRGRRPRSPEQSGRAGPSYSQQEAHVGRGAGCGSVVARPRARRRRRPGRKRQGEEGEERRCGAAPAVPQPQLARLRESQWHAEGAEVGSARPEALNGRGRKGRRGNGARLPRQQPPRPPQCHPSPPPRRPPAAPTPRSLARATRAHSGPRTAALGASVPDACAAPPHAPRGRSGGAGGSSPSAGVGCGGGGFRDAPVRVILPEGRGFNSGMSGSCCEGWNRHQNFAHSECQQTMMGGYGACLLLHKIGRKFHLGGMVCVWFCQKRGKDLTGVSRSLLIYGRILTP